MNLSLRKLCLPRQSWESAGILSNVADRSGLEIRRSIEIGYESGLRWAPFQLRPRPLAGSHDVHGRKVRKPREMGRRLVRTLTDDGNVQAPANHFGDFPVGYAL